VTGLPRGENRRRGHHVAEEPVVDNVRGDEQRPEHACPDENPRAGAPRQQEQPECGRHDRRSDDEPVCRGGRLEERVVYDEQRLDGERSRAPRNIGDGPERAHERTRGRAAAEGEQPGERDRKRHRREHRNQARHDDDEPARLPGRDL
jgi:hypothetical protein